MKDHTNDTYCNYSFEALYLAAFGKNISKTSLAKMKKYSQEKINFLVEKWAAVAGWNTEEKIGSDGIRYIAFAPFSALP